MTAARPLAARIRTAYQQAARFLVTGLLAAGIVGATTGTTRAQTPPTPGADANTGTTIAPSDAGIRPPHYSQPSAPSSAPASSAASSAPPASPPDAAAGLALYREHCVDCHGAFGRGDGRMLDRLPAPPPSFADTAAVGRLSPRAALEVISEGRLDKLMPPWKDRLSLEERLAVLYGAWSFSFTSERLVGGRATWDASCAGCHGATPGATGRPAFDAAWWWTRSQDDAAAAMREAAVHADLGGLAADDLRAALDYARAGSFKALPYRDLAADGVIAGRLANGTAGAAGVSGAVVSLIPFHQEVPGILPGRAISATLGADGAFRFAGLLSGPGLSYHVLTRYQGADIIAREPISLGGEAPKEARLDTTVYEASADAPVRASLAQMVLAPRPEEGAVDVAEAWTVVNDSDRTRIGAPGAPVLSFKVPATASDIAFDDPGQQAAATFAEGELGLDYPLPPGEKTLLFSYRLPYAGRSLVLDSRPPVDVDHFELMAVGGEVAIESADLDPFVRETHGGDSIAVAKAEGLAAGAAWSARLTDLPAPAGGAPRGPVRLRAWGPSNTGGTWLGLGLMALALAALAYGAGRERRSHAFRRRADRLIAAIADLDTRHGRGDLDEAAYRRQRALLVGQALALPEGDLAGEASPESTSRGGG